MIINAEGEKESSFDKCSHFLDMFRSKGNCLIQ